MGARTGAAERQARAERRRALSRQVDAGVHFATLPGMDGAPDTANNPTLPPNASLWTRLRLGYRSLQILAEDPGDPYHGPLLNACLDSETYAALARSWRERPEGRELLDTRPTLQGRDLDLDALAQLPDGSLGREFVRYFARNGIEPFVSSFPVETDVDYLSKRYRETHDIFHVVTGYGTDGLGEMELQAFVFGNLGLRQTLMILLFSVPPQVRAAGLSSVSVYRRRLRAAYRRGRRSRELLSVRFEQLWDRPVAELEMLLCGT